MEDADGPELGKMLLASVAILALAFLAALVQVAWQMLGQKLQEIEPSTPPNVKECSACLEKKGEEAFSKKQWKAKQVRRCIACATPAAAGPTPDQTDLVERLRLAASQRSSLDAEAEDEARRRRLRRTHRRAERAERAAAAREDADLRAERGRFERRVAAAMRAVAAELRAERGRYDGRVTAALRAFAQGFAADTPAVRRRRFDTPESWSFDPVNGTGHAMIEDLRVLYEAFGPNLPQVLRHLESLDDGVHILGCRFVDEVPDH